MVIDITFHSMLFMPAACLLMCSYWTFKELYFDHYMSTFSIEIVLCVGRKYVIVDFSYISALFALYICVVRLGMAPSGL